MFASLLVFGVMIGLILLSVWLFPGEVEAGTLGVATSLWVPFTFFAYLTPLVTFVMVRAYFLHKDQLADDEDADQVYGAEPTDLPPVKDLA